MFRIVNEEYDQNSSDSEKSEIIEPPDDDLSGDDEIVDRIISKLEFTDSVITSPEFATPFNEICHTLRNIIVAHNDDTIIRERRRRNELSDLDEEYLYHLRNIIIKHPIEPLYTKKKSKSRGNSARSTSKSATSRPRRSSPSKISDQESSMRAEAQNQLLAYLSLEVAKEKHIPLSANPTNLLNNDSTTDVVMNDDSLPPTPILETPFFEEVDRLEKSGSASKYGFSSSPTAPSLISFSPISPSKIALSPNEKFRRMVGHIILELGKLKVQRLIAEFVTGVTVTGVSDRKLILRSTFALRIPHLLTDSFGKSRFWTLWRSFREGIGKYTTLSTLKSRLDTIRARTMLKCGGLINQIGDLERSSLKDKNQRLLKDGRTCGLISNYQYEDEIMDDNAIEDAENVLVDILQKGQDVTLASVRGYFDASFGPQGSGISTYPQLHAQPSSEVHGKANESRLEKKIMSNSGKTSALSSGKTILPVATKETKLVNGLDLNSSSAILESHLSSDSIGLTSSKTSMKKKSTFSERINFDSSKNNGNNLSFGRLQREASLSNTRRAFMLQQIQFRQEDRAIRNKLNNELANIFPSSSSPTLNNNSKLRNITYPLTNASNNTEMNTINLKSGRTIREELQLGLSETSSGRFSPNLHNFGDSQVGDILELSIGESLAAVRELMHVAKIQLNSMKQPYKSHTAPNASLISASNAHGAIFQQSLIPDLNSTKHKKKIKKKVYHELISGLTFLKKFCRKALPPSLLEALALPGSTADLEGPFTGSSQKQRNRLETSESLFCAPVLTPCTPINRYDMNSFDFPSNAGRTRFSTSHPCSVGPSLNNIVTMVNNALVPDPFGRRGRNELDFNGLPHMFDSRGAIWTKPSSPIIEQKNITPIYMKKLMNDLSVSQTSLTEDKNKEATALLKSSRSVGTLCEAAETDQGFHTQSEILRTRAAKLKYKENELVYPFEVRAQTAIGIRNKSALYLPAMIAQNEQQRNKFAFGSSTRPMIPGTRTGIKSSFGGDINNLILGLNRSTHLNSTLGNSQALNNTGHQLKNVAPCYNAAIGDLSPKRFTTHAQAPGGVGHPKFLIDKTRKDLMKQSNDPRLQNWRGVDFISSLAKSIETFTWTSELFSSPPVTFSQVLSENRMLVVPNSKLTDEEIVMMAAVLATVQRPIEILDISNNCFGDFGFITLLHVLRDSRSQSLELKELDVSNNSNVTAIGIEVLLDALSSDLSHITTLNVSGLKFGDYLISRFGLALRTVSHPSNAFSAAENFASIRELRMSSVGLGLTAELSAVEFLETLWAVCPDLQVLDLSESKLSPACLSVISNIASTRSLIELRLDKMTGRLHHNPDEKICKRWGFSAASGHQRSYVDVDPIFEFLEQLRFASNLRVLSLSGCSIPASACLVLYDSMEELQHINEIDLSANPLGDFGIRCMIRLLARHRSLVLVKLEQSSRPESTRLDGCEIPFPAFCFTDPSGFYSLDLSECLDRAIFRQLLKRRLDPVCQSEIAPYSVNGKITNAPDISIPPHVVISQLAPSFVTHLSTDKVIPILQENFSLIPSITFGSGAISGKKKNKEANTEPAANKSVMNDTKKKPCFVELTFRLYFRRDLKDALQKDPLRNLAAAESFSASRVALTPVKFSCVSRTLNSVPNDDIKIRVIRAAASESLFEVSQLQRIIQGLSPSIQKSALSLLLQNVPDQTAVSHLKEFLGRGRRAHLSKNIKRAIEDAQFKRQRKNGHYFGENGNSDIKSSTKPMKNNMKHDDRLDSSSMKLFVPENPTGRYKLDLSFPSDRAIAQRLLLFGRYESEIMKKLPPKRGDVSQHGNFWPFRNESLDGSAIIITNEFFLPPEGGILQLDVCSQLLPDDFLLLSAIEKSSENSKGILAINPDLNKKPDFHINTETINDNTNDDTAKHFLDDDALSCSSKGNETNEGVPPLMVYLPLEKCPPLLPPPTSTSPEDWCLMSPSVFPKSTKKTANRLDVLRPVRPLTLRRIFDAVMAANPSLFPPPPNSLSLSPISPPSGAPAPSSPPLKGENISNSAWQVANSRPLSPKESFEQNALVVPSPNRSMTLEGIRQIGNKGTLSTTGGLMNNGGLMGVGEGLSVSRQVLGMLHDLAVYMEQRRLETSIAGYSHSGGSLFDLEENKIDFMREEFDNKRLSTSNSDSKIIARSSIMIGLNMDRSMIESSFRKKLNSLLVLPHFSQGIELGELVKFELLLKDISKGIAKVDGVAYLFISNDGQFSVSKHESSLHQMKNNTTSSGGVKNLQRQLAFKMLRENGEINDSASIANQQISPTMVYKSLMNNPVVQSAIRWSQTVDNASQHHSQPLKMEFDKNDGQTAARNNETIAKAMKGYFDDEASEQDDVANEYPAFVDGTDGGYVNQNNNSINQMNRTTIRFTIGSDASHVNDNQTLAIRSRANSLFRPSGFSLVPSNNHQRKSIFSQHLELINNSVSKSINQNEVPMQPGELDKAFAAINFGTPESTSLLDGRARSNQLLEIAPFNASINSVFHSTNNNIPVIGPLNDPKEIAKRAIAVHQAQTCQRTCVQISEVLIALRVALSRCWITCHQARVIVSGFNESSVKTELLTFLFNRIIDRENIHLIFDDLKSSSQTELKERLGLLRILSWSKFGLSTLNSSTVEMEEEGTSNALKNKSNAWWIYGNKSPSLGVMHSFLGVRPSKVDSSLSNNDVLSDSETIKSKNDVISDAGGTSKTKATTSVGSGSTVVNSGGGVDDTSKKSGDDAEITLVFNLTYHDERQAALLLLSLCRSEDKDSKKKEDEAREKEGISVVRSCLIVHAAYETASSSSSFGTYGEGDDGIKYATMDYGYRVTLKHNMDVMNSLPSKKRTQLSSGSEPRWDIPLSWVQGGCPKDGCLRMIVKMNPSAEKPSARKNLAMMYAGSYV